MHSFFLLLSKDVALIDSYNWLLVNKNRAGLVMKPSQRALPFILTYYCNWAWEKKILPTKIQRIERRKKKRTVICAVCGSWLFCCTDMAFISWLKNYSRERKKLGAEFATFFSCFFFRCLVFAVFSPISIDKHWFHLIRRQTESKLCKCDTKSSGPRYLI